MTTPRPETPTEAAAARLEGQVAFLRELDKLKDVLRQTILPTSGRRENSAEHCWHAALAALVLAEHANEPVDAGRVAHLMLMHDIVEIDAGDTFVYSNVDPAEQHARETLAAQRIFGLLPAGQRDFFLALWEEFEARATAESRFAAALDRFLPLQHNYLTQGGAWRKHGITEDRVRARNRKIEEGSAALWAIADRYIAEAVAQGWLAPAPAAASPGPA